MQITTTKNGLVVQQNNHPLLAPRAADEPKQNVFNAVNAAIALAYAHLDWTVPNDQQKDFLVNGVTDSIVKNFPSIRVQEIKIAIANGIRGAYGEYFGLSVISFENFIKGYLESEQRAELAKNRPELEDEKEPDTDKKFHTAKSNALVAYQKFIDHVDFSSIALPAYSFLSKIKVINFTNEEKFEFMDEAKIQLESELKLQKSNCLDKVQRNQFASKLTQLLAGKETNAVIIKAQKIALTAFFQSISLENNVLTDLIDANRQNFTEGGQNG